MSKILTVDQKVQPSTYGIDFTLRLIKREMRSHEVARIFPSFLLGSFPLMESEFKV